MTSRCAATVVRQPLGTANSMCVVPNERTRQSLDLEPDDVVVVETGEERIIARVHGSHPPTDQTGPAVGLNSLHRETMSVALDETVRLKSYTPSAATTVTLHAAAPTCRPFGSEDLDEIRKSLYLRPVISGTQFWLMSEECNQFGVVPGEWHPINVVDTESDRPLYIDHQTTIRTPQRRFRLTEPSSRDEESTAQPWEVLRSRVLTRDSQTCQNTGCDRQAPTDLEVHFIVPPRTRGAVALGNLVTLCHNCHRATHRRRSSPTR